MACPSTNALAELVVGGLAGADGEALEAHLAACAPCRRATAALMASTLGARPRGHGSDVAAAAGPRDGADSEAPTALLLAPGTKLGRYVVQELLGAGGMGVVYAARDPELDRRVALKLLHPRRAAASAARAELLAEAQAMAKIRHPNVVGVHDVAMHGELVTIAMELVPGQSLRRWLDEPRPWQEIVEVLTAAGRGLAAAHALGLVHRDFKPENVLVGEGGQVCVGDFGLAQPSGGEVEDIAGTPAYMAPEQRRGARPDPRADQYSFCLVLREALEGRRPGAAPAATPTTRELLRRLGAAPAADSGLPSGPGADARSAPTSDAGGLPSAPGSDGRSASTSDAGGLPSAPRSDERAAASAARPAPRRHVPRWLRAVIARGLREQPAERFPSMTALLEALRPPRRWPWVVAPAALAASVALSLLFFSPSMRRHVPSSAAGCTDEPAELRALWSPPRRARLLAALERDGQLPAATVAALAADLDRHVGQLGAARAAACRANRDPRGAALFDRQTACLDERQAALAARLACLEAEDRQARARAVELVSGLPAIADCAAGSALLGLPPLPGDAATRHALATAQLALATAAAQRAAGLPLEALRTLEPARGLDYAPLAAAIELERGRLHDELGHTHEAEAAFAAAVERGLRGGASDVTTRALFERAALRQSRYADRERADEYLAQARALHERAHGAAPLAPELEQLLAHVYLQRGELDLADAAIARGLAALGHGEELPARIDRQLLGEAAGRVLQARGELPRAQARLRGVYEALRQLLGPRHPTVGRLAAELGVLSEKLGQREASIAYFGAAELGLGGSAGIDQQAVASISYLMRPQAQRTSALDREHGLRLTALGSAPRKLDEAVVYSGLGALLLMYAGDRALARHTAERALALVGKQAVDNVDIASVVLALLELEADARPAARAHADRVIAIQRKRRDPDPIMLAHALLVRGIQRHLADELPAALADFDEAAAIAAADTSEDTAELDELLPFWRGVTRRRAGLPGADTDGAALLRLQIELGENPDISPQMKPSLTLAVAGLAR